MQLKFYRVAVKVNKLAIAIAIKAGKLLDYSESIKLLPIMY